MKKIISTSFALAAGIVLVHAQGTISLQEDLGTVITNGTSIGEGTGNAYLGTGSYYYDVLDMSAAAWAGLSSQQRAGADNLLANPTDVAFWTDSGVTGVNAGSLTAGGIKGLGGAVGSTAANWAAPTSVPYSSASGYDYYIVVGWSADMGTGWATLSSEMSNGALPSGGWFGETVVMYNYAGGGSVDLYAPNVFAPSSFTGLSGSGYDGSNPALTLLPVPEPTTLALAGLGGVSMLFLRRRKS